MDNINFLLYLASDQRESAFYRTIGHEDPVAHRGSESQQYIFILIYMGFIKAVG